MKDPGRHGKPRHHQVGLGPDMGFPLQLRGDDRLGGNIPGPQVLFQGQVDEAVDQGGDHQVIHSASPPGHPEPEIPQE